VQSGLGALASQVVERGLPIGYGSRSAPAFMIRQRVLNDMIEPIDLHDPIENSDPHDAIEPTDRSDPTDPTDNTEPLEQIDSTEFSDHSDHLEGWSAPRTQQMLERAPEDPFSGAVR
jgi:hypothetical protein